MGRSLVGGAHGKLVHIGPPDKDGTRPFKILEGMRGIGRPVPVKDPRCTACPVSAVIEIVFDGQRNPQEGGAFTVRQSGIGRTGLFPGLVQPEFDKGVDRTCVGCIGRTFPFDGIMMSRAEVRGIQLLPAVGQYSSWQDSSEILRVVR